jgi:hypothetical protein
MKIMASETIQSHADERGGVFIFGVEVGRRRCGLCPKDVVTAWVDAFNANDADRLASFYAVDAVNHQVDEAPVQDREAVRTPATLERPSMGCEATITTPPSPEAGPQGGRYRASAWT